MRITPQKWTILLAILLLVTIAASIAYWTGMPLRSYSGPLRPLTLEEQKIRDDLRSYVNQLSLTIGERNLDHATALNSASEYLLQTFGEYGFSLSTYQYPVNGKFVKNIEVRVQGIRPASTVVVGAHYDSAAGSPGADDNATGVAAVLELAQLLKNSAPGQTIRFVVFVNEEPPYFQTSNMGSLVYAKNLHRENVNVSGMLSLESIGYYSDAKGGQRYPGGFGLLYPDVGNFIGFVGNSSSRDLVVQAMKAFRETTDFPSEGVAAPGSLAGIGWSDQWSFWQEGYMGLMVTDTAPFRNPHYHRSSDTPDTIDFDRMARVVGGLKRVIFKLAQ